VFVKLRWVVEVWLGDDILDVVHPPLVVCILQRDRWVKGRHSSGNCQNCISNVLLDVFDFLPLFLFGKAINMKNPHLLDDGGFARFSCPKEKETMGCTVDLFVFLNLLLNSLIGFLPLLVLLGIILGTSSSKATHDICQDRLTPTSSSVVVVRVGGSVGRTMSMALMNGNW